LESADQNPSASIRLPDTCIINRRTDSDRSGLAMECGSGSSGRQAEGDPGTGRRSGANLRRLQPSGRKLGDDDQIVFSPDLGPIFCRILGRGSSARADSAQIRRKQPSLATSAVRRSGCTVYRRLGTELGRLSIEIQSLMAGQGEPCTEPAQMAAAFPAVTSCTPVRASDGVVCQAIRPRPPRCNGLPARILEDGAVGQRAIRRFRMAAGSPQFGRATENQR
jgi:hypothetical protein